MKKNPIALIIALMTFFQLSFTQHTSYKYNLSICAIFQNEASYMREWIEFHKLVGVEHFYLYNNFSNDNFIEILNPYIKSGEVEIIDWQTSFTNFSTFSFGKTGAYTGQYSAYTDALHRTSGVSKWVAFIDLDEFLFPVLKDNLQDFLQEYENCGGIMAHWVLFGTSKVKQIPKNGLIIEYLTHCEANENKHVKSIVRPERADFFNSAHIPHYIKPFSAKVFSIDQIRINHYWTRDEFYFYNSKIPRAEKLKVNLTAGAIWGIDTETAHKMTATEWALAINDLINISEDYTIYKYLNALKQKLNIAINN